MKRLKEKSRTSNHSMEPMREPLKARYSEKSEIIKAIKTSWSELPETTWKDMKNWRNEGRP